MPVHFDNTQQSCLLRACQGSDVWSAEPLGAVTPCLTILPQQSKGKGTRLPDCSSITGDAHSGLEACVKHGVSISFGSSCHSQLMRSFCLDVLQQTLYCRLCEPQQSVSLLLMHETLRNTKGSSRRKEMKAGRGKHWLRKGEHEWKRRRERGHIQGRVRAAVTERCPFLLKWVPITLPFLWREEKGAKD